MSFSSLVQKRLIRNCDNTSSTYSATCRCPTPSLPKIRSPRRPSSCYPTEACSFDVRCHSLSGHSSLGAAEFFKHAHSTLDTLSCRITTQSSIKASPELDHHPPQRTSPVLLASSPVTLSHTITMPKQPSKKSKKRNDFSDSDSSDVDEPMHFFVPGERINPDVLSLFLFTYIDKTSRIRPCPHPTVRNPSRILFMLIMPRTKPAQASMSLPAGS